MSNLGFSSTPQKLISNHFFLILQAVIRPTNVPSDIMIIFDFAELWYPKFGKKCRYSRFLEVITTLNFFLDYKFEKLDFKTILRHIRINYQHIWSFSSAENVLFGLSIERSFCRFLPILPNFESDYLDNQKR